MVDYVDSLIRFMESSLVKKDAKVKMVTEWQKFVSKAKWNFNICLKGYKYKLASSILCSAHITFIFIYIFSIML